METPLVLALPVDLRGLTSVAVIDDASIALVRELVRVTCRDQGLGAIEAESLVTAASELAHNQLAHAGRGEVFVREVTRAGTRGVEVIALDRGPGIAEPARALRGGSAAPTGLGAGLAAARRLTDELDVDVRRREGTCIRARKFAAKPAFSSEVAILGRPFDREPISGDDATFVRAGDALILCVVDGLGHGELARRASARAIELVQQRAAARPRLEQILVECHAALRETRGAAMALVSLDRRSRALDYACLGDIGLQAVGYRAAQRLVCRPGIVGVQPGRRGATSTTTTVPGEALVLAYTDGLGTSIDISRDPVLLREHPLVVADHLLATYGRASDDALVLVAR